MKTTELIAELLVGGVMTGTWILLLLMNFLGVDSILEFFKENSIGGTAFFFVYAYILGVIFDRIWDFVTIKYVRRIEKKHYENRELLKKARREIFGKEKNGDSFIDYIRSRMRIARSSVCNIPLIGLASLLLYHNVSNNAEKLGYILIIFSFLLFSTVSFLAFRKLLNTYYKSLKIFSDPKESSTKSYKINVGGKDYTVNVSQYE